jgi:hypothetical protein
VLGIPTTSRKKTDMGTVVHKVLEILAHKKLTLQNNKKFFTDEQLGKFHVDKCDPYEILENSFKYYESIADEKGWTATDFKSCNKWLNEALTFGGGEYNPLNRKIISPEQQFDIEIKKPWAGYNYTLPDGKRLAGNLCIKGTIDLVTELEPGIIEIIDWKTGSRKNWITGEEKDYQYLQRDSQLLLYYYAATHLYPNAKQILMTIFYLEEYQFKKHNNGGPFTIPFTQKDFDYTENMLKQRFLEIKKITRPKLNITWCCNKFCYFGTHNATQDPSKTYCQFFRDKIGTEGMEKVVEDYADLSKINKYENFAGRKE